MLSEMVMLGIWNREDGYEILSVLFDVLRLVIAESVIAMTTPGGVDV